VYAQSRPGETNSREVGRAGRASSPRGVRQVVRERKGRPGSLKERRLEQLASVTARSPSPQDTRLEGGGRPRTQSPRNVTLAETRAGVTIAGRQGRSAVEKTNAVSLVHAWSEVALVDRGRRIIQPASRQNTPRNLSPRNRERSGESPGRPPMSPTDNASPRRGAIRPWEGREGGRGREKGKEKGRSTVVALHHSRSFSSLSPHSRTSHMPLGDEKVGHNVARAMTVPSWL